MSPKAMTKDRETGPTADAQAPADGAGGPMADAQAPADGAGGPAVDAQAPAGYSVGDRIDTRYFPSPFLQLGHHARRQSWAPGFELLIASVGSRSGQMLRLMTTGGRGGQVEWRPQNMADEMMADDWEAIIVKPFFGGDDITPDADPAPDSAPDPATGA